MVLYSDSGLPSDVTIIGENTTEKRKVREELEKTNAKLTDLFDNANDLIQIFKPNGSIIFTNLTWRTKLGYTEEEVSKLKLKDILWTGKIPHKDIGGYYTSGSVFVLPSSREVFGISVLEAQASGLPVIISDAVVNMIRMVKGDGLLSFNHKDEKQSTR